MQPQCTVGRVTIASSLFIFWQNVSLKHFLERLNIWFQNISNYFSPLIYFCKIYFHFILLFFLLIIFHQHLALPCPLPPRSPLTPPPATITTLLYMFMSFLSFFFSFLLSPVPLPHTPSPTRAVCRLSIYESVSILLSSSVQLNSTYECKFFLSCVCFQIKIRQKRS